ncbi:S8 family serine peptidase [Brevibacillus laterosporus]|uniref:S8 family serine peptidase n=1 Tax=Brevibacillus laterosporus TaxID=1465 RepID=UPI001F54B524|nr:S8 family serine peptidase [Brevibacillus laterosporus]
MNIHSSDQMISAEVVLQSKSGQSLLTTNVPITSENVELFQPSEKVLAEAKQLIEANGLTVHTAGVTMTVSGTKKQFAQWLGEEWNKGNPQIPSHMQHVVEQVVFQENKPVYYDKTSGKGRKEMTENHDVTEVSSMPPIIFAEASVHSVEGESLFATTGSITHENVERYYNKPELVDKAVEKLKEAGFEVLHIGNTTINISAPPETYEKTFNTKIVAEERSVMKHGQMGTATILDDPSTEMSGLIDTSNSTLSDVLEGVAINEPVYYLSLGDGGVATLERPSSMATPPSATAPNVQGYYLDVPEDVARILQADSVHDEGITGRGVHVAMVDSGWYRHPYFEAKGYHANQVVLAPGATAPTHDESGHGTGESANIFPLAPHITFTMVKQGGLPNVDAAVNAAGDFNTAVQLQPDVITCSWGFDTKQRSSISAFERVLSTAVANAVRQGITVVFSAGNGHISFPGQHPDVISAGGVYVDETGRMQASNYSSGFNSRIFPGRKVPDVCGLVGMQPRAQYIMLPVEPGDELDEAEAKIDPMSGSTDVDGTTPSDGWARFSGTSAAAPQLAGICALLKQANPAITPQKIKEVLMSTATDITVGVNALGAPAGPGSDIATGSGLANAKKAVQLARNIH